MIPNGSSQTKELLRQSTNRTPILMITIIITSVHCTYVMYNNNDLL